MEKNAAAYRWWKAGELQKWWPERFLKSREPFCVSACARFLSMRAMFDKLFVLSTQSGDVGAVLFQSGKTLFPIFGSLVDITLPVHMYRLLKMSDIRVVQGLWRDTVLMENLLARLGVRTITRIDYDLLNLDRPADLAPPPHPLPNLVLRRPLLRDLDSLMPVQAAYQKEEVLLDSAQYSAKLCRAQTEHIIRNEKALLACHGGSIIGKINTNAHSFSRLQIGGVFVVPAWRSRGVASVMTREFCRSLLAEGSALTLFVKKNNLAAQRVYKKTGFRKCADYSILYTEAT